MKVPFTRRDFFKGAVLGAGIAAIGARAADKPIAGFDETDAGAVKDGVWRPVSDRKIKMGIVGYGVCKFGAAFSLQNHPNVEVVAASDLFPDRCAALAKKVGAKKTYASCEEMFEKDKEIEAVFIATDAPSHARLVVAGLKRGLHMASAVPAVWGDDQLELAEEMLALVKKTGLTYAMFETTSMRPQCYAMRKIYQAGGFGKLMYSEGEYHHYCKPGHPIDSYKGWRIASPPQWYPTHANAFYTCVTGGHFTNVTCMGMPSTDPLRQPDKNAYNNPFGTEVALMRTSEGGMARMMKSADMPGAHGETGRVYGQKGCYEERYSGLADLSKIDLKKPPLPPGMSAGGHGGAHGYLADDFIQAILLKRKPCVDIACALNTTVSGIISHQSAMKDGETLRIPLFKL
ncbi:MAG: Gfo/Idh/MocA family oxidoreductase [Kiritimatiellae bacterium]|jgi:predicted dehydrogenase|nr:Gfo/Idh/MocA family oxidoreductase [Kiritimatiellia bacterium]